jgi:hypothetical protein
MGFGEVGWMVGKFGKWCSTRRNATARVDRYSFNI